MTNQPTPPTDAELQQQVAEFEAVFPDLAELPVYDYANVKAGFEATAIEAVNVSQIRTKPIC